MSKRVLLVTEGPHDVAALARLLRNEGFHRVQRLDALHGTWRRLVPQKFPHDDDLMKRVPVPGFVARGDDSVAIMGAGGVSTVARWAQANLANLADVSALGLVVDADGQQPPDITFQALQAAMPQLALGAGPGVVHVAAGQPATGAWILPDNTSAGTLEDLLLAGANIAYPSLLASAHAWVAPLDPTDATVFTTREERRDLAKPRGKDKAVVGAIGAVLRPGKAIQTSIDDNRWLMDPAVLTHPPVAALRQWLLDLLAA